METRRIYIESRNDAFLDGEYTGPYLEEYEELSEDFKDKETDGWFFRVGKIFDTVQNRVVAFKQIVVDREDSRPTRIATMDMDPVGGLPPCRGPQPYAEKYYYISHLFLRAMDNVSLKSCAVYTLAIREPTDEEKLVFGGARKQQSPSKKAPRETATPTAQLEAEILRILSRDFTDTRARPTAAEFYQAHIINGRTMAGLARSKDWAERTMKTRKAAIKKHLAFEFGMPVDLDELQAAPRKSGRIVTVDPGIIERTHANEDGRD